jgi:hypothetical protein
MIESLVGNEGAVIRETGQEVRPAVSSGLLEQLRAGVAESVRLQTQLSERFAVRLLEFGNSLRAVEQTCRLIDGRIERLAAKGIEGGPRLAPVALPAGYAPNRFDVVHRAPALMAMSERVVLYSLVVGLRPRRCLEIGTHRGGSALIIVAALDDIGQGSLACVDLAPTIEAEDWRAIAHRAVLHPGASLGVLAEMARGTGGRFDFALIDGDHSTAGALGDIQGVLPVLEDTAHIVLHDAHNEKVSEAILVAIGNAGNGLTDCGMISAEKFDPTEGEYWGGLRLLRFSRKKLVGGGRSGCGF